MFPLELDRDRFRERVDKAFRRAQRSGVRWCPAIDGPSSRVVAAELANLGVTNFLCETAFEAERLASSGELAVLDGSPLVILGRAVSAIEQFSPTLCPTLGIVLLTVDHFAHVRWLCELPSRFDRPWPVLIRLQVSDSDAGCRPGRDAVELARGLEASDRCRFVGLIARAIAADESPRVWTLLRQTRRQLDDSQIACDWVVGDVTDPPEETFPDGFELWTDPVWLDDSDSESQPLCSVQTIVVSRPRLDCVVLETEQNGNMTADAPRLECEPEAVLLRRTSRETTFRVHGRGRDLQIGERTRLWLPDPRQRVRNSDTLVFRDYENRRIPSTDPT